LEELRMEGSKSKKMKTCSSCGTEIAKSAKACPQCGAKNKKPIYKRVWFIIFVAIVVIGIASNLGGKQNEGSASTPAPSTTSGSNAATATKEYTPYDVSVLMSDLNSNAMKAEEKYKKANVKITGRLNVIDSSGKYISLTPTNDEYAIIGVQCYIKNEDQKNKIMNMSIGDTVILSGQIKDVGEIMGYSLDIDTIE
jgi:RNA polymerase subunit RPABC4/transcription elongation factor Spt4